MALAALLVLIAAACDRRLIVRAYTIPSNKLHRPIRAVLLADLHGFRFGRDQATLLRMIAGQNPDIILMAGDMVDDRRRLENSMFFLREVVKIAPAYYTPGNHEFRRQDWPDLAGMAESYGVVVLSDRVEEIRIGDNAFVLAGADDTAKRRWDRNYQGDAVMEQLFVPLTDQPGYHILIGHRPDRIDQYKRYDFDLIVSGHAHGGQVRIPGLVNGLFAPQQGVFPPYTGGAYRHGNTVHVVSRGLAKPVFLPKVFIRPEVVVVKLVPEG